MYNYCITMLLLGILIILFILPKFALAEEQAVTKTKIVRKTIFIATTQNVLSFIAIILSLCTNNQNQYYMVFIKFEKL